MNKLHQLIIENPVAACLLLTFICLALGSLFGNVLYYLSNKEWASFDQNKDIVRVEIISWLFVAWIVYLICRWL